MVVRHWSRLPRVSLLPTKSLEAQTFIAQLGDPYIDSAYDGDGRVGINWGVYGAPETFLIGADGTVLEKHLGPMSWAVWREKFAPYLAPEGVN